MKKFFKDIATDYDNKTYDTGRVIALWAVFFITSGEAVNVAFLAQAFDPIRYAMAISSVVAALAVAIFGQDAKRPDKARFEKEPEENK